MKSSICLFSLILLLSAVIGHADTFTHQSNGQVYHGYVLHTEPGAQTVVYTQEKGSFELDLSSFTVERNFEGRNNFVSQITLDKVIVSQLQVEAFTEALIEESNKGPLFILLVLDNGDGITLRMREISRAIQATTNCTIIGYIPGFKFPGVQCCGLAAAFCCDKLYIASDACMSWARTYTEAQKAILPYFRDKEEHQRIINDENSGKAVQEETWVELIARLAREKGRSELLARSFFDDSLEVWKVEREGKKIFIEAADKKETDKSTVLMVSSGYHLDLDSDKAVMAGLADKVIENVDALYAELKVHPEKTEENLRFQTQSKKYYDVLEKFSDITSTIDEKISVINANGGGYVNNRGQTSRDYRELIKNVQYLMRLKKMYPDVPYTSGELDEMMTNVKVHYEAMKNSR